MKRVVMICLSQLLVLMGLLTGVTPPAFGGGFLSAYGIRMEPQGDDAEDYSRAGWGAGAEVVVPVPQIWNIAAGTFGVEFVNLLSSTRTFQDRVTGLRAEQHTSQDYIRIYTGMRVGGHGRGFLRPHAGLNVALIPYSISTDVVIPDDYDRENEIRQNLEEETHVVFGYDITLGVDLNIKEKIIFGPGVRYVKSFSVPQQLGDGSVKIHPEYLQAYFGIGVTFDYLLSQAEGEGEDDDDDDW